MSLALSRQQTEQVQRKQKNSSELPSYFNSDLRTKVQISRDFEAFLILSSDDLKTSAVEWINKAVDLQRKDKDRDELVGLALEQERVNAQSKIKVLDQSLQDFNKFRLKFQGQDQFAGVPEVQRFLFDLQRVVEEISSNRERALFDDVASQVVGTVSDRTVVTEPQIEQLRSWTEALSVYLQG